MSFEYVVSGCHHSISVVTDKQSEAQPLKGPTEGLSIRMLGDATLLRGHVDRKH